MLLYVPEGMVLQQALTSGGSHAPFRVMLALAVFFSLVLVNLTGYHWEKEQAVSPSPLPCTSADCHCDQSTPHTSQNEATEGMLAHLPTNLIPLETIRKKPFRHTTFHAIQGLSHLDQLSLSRFYACSPAKMILLQSVGANEKTCYKQREFQRGGSKPIVALVSFQGSGNTWVRHILEQYTGVFTGSIYCDSILKSVYPGEHVVSNNVLVVKTHHADTTSLPPDVQQTFGKRDYDKAIVLLRNPFDALLSEGNRRWTGMMQPLLDQHVGVANEHAFIG